MDERADALNTRHRKPTPAGECDLRAEILAIKMVLTPIVGAILDAPAVVSQYRHLLNRAEEERGNAAAGTGTLDETTFNALISAEKWLRDMSSDYLERKLKPETPPAGTPLS